MRKLIAFDADTAAKMTELARNRMATLQELADEAFADLLKKHGVPIDLKDALRKSAAATTNDRGARSVRSTPASATPHRATTRPARKPGNVRHGNRSV